MQQSKRKIPTSDIIKFLSSTDTNATFTQKLKIRYRPYICPFDELLNYAESSVESVYDVGCGSGQFAALVARFTDVKRLHGIEINQKLVDNATGLADTLPDLKAKKLTFSLFDGKTIPKNIKDYDLVYMIDVYHHVPTDIRVDMLKQIYKNMKPGAKLMFKDINGASPFVLCNRVHDRTFGGEFGHEISFRAARELLEGIGFKIHEARKKQVAVYPHYFILAEK